MAPDDCRCALLREHADVADGADVDALLDAPARDPDLLDAPHLPGEPAFGPTVRRWRCARCGSAWRLTEPDAARRVRWRREDPQRLDALAGDLAALECLLRREGGAPLLPGVRELRRVIESIGPDAAGALTQAHALLGAMLSHKEGLADFHVWRDAFDERIRENEALQALMSRVQRGLQTACA